MNLTLRLFAFSAVMFVLVSTASPTFAQAVFPLAEPFSMSHEVDALRGKTSDKR